MITYLNSVKECQKVGTFKFAMVVSMSKRFSARSDIAECVIMNQYDILKRFAQWQSHENK